jgi:hypothetical protein
MMTRLREWIKYNGWERKLFCVNGVLPTSSSSRGLGMNEVYIGLAAEAAEENNLIDNYNTSVFSNVTFSGPPVITLDQQSRTVTSSVYAQPALISKPGAGTVTSSVYTISGTISEPGLVTVNGEEIILDSSL